MHAARAALADAGIPWTDVDLIVGGETVRNGYGGYVAGATFAQALGWNGARVATSYAACATGAQALDTARARILAGLCEVALVVGADTTPKGFLAPNAGERWDDPDWLRFRLLGMTNPAYFALYARRRMDLYGATQADFAAVKVKNARHGLHNPNARYRKEVSAEDVLSSAIVADPLHLLDICATSDGAPRWCSPRSTTPVGTASRRRCGCARSRRSPRPSRNTVIDMPLLSTDPATRAARPDLQAVDRRRGLRGGRDRSGGRRPGRGLRPLDRAGARLDRGPRAVQGGEAEPLLRAGDTTIGGRIPVNPAAGWPASARPSRRRRWPRSAR